MIQLLDIDGMSCPVFACDTCGQPVHGREGLLLWNWAGQPPVMIAVHKLDCDHIAEAKYGGELGLLSRDLDEFIEQLAHNTTHLAKPIVWTKTVR